jgi:hypothetical protein
MLLHDDPSFGKVVRGGRERGKMDRYVSSVVENVLCALTALLLQGEVQFRT